MAYERRGDRRQGARPGGGRPDRGARGGRGPGGYGDRPGDRGGDRPPRERDFGGRAPRERSFASRGDEGGMSIRLDPRRLAGLKLLAAEAGLRPGELVTAWVEERLDAARSGAPPPAAPPSQALAELSARVDELALRLDELAARPTDPAAAAQAAEAPAAAAKAEPAPQPAEAQPARAKRRGRPPKARPAEPDQTSQGDAGGERQPRVPLHEEIEAVIAERGPLTATEIASAISERGRYSPPRSTRPLDAATVNSRVSNPAYRSRFERSDGRIGLAASSPAAS